MDQTFKKTAALALAGAFAATLGISAATTAQAEDFEKCYGVWKAGENDCASEGSNSCAGTSTVDFDGLAWKLVKAGTCTSIEVTTPEGEARKGSLEPISG
jgi:uncharacterized membrane protein